MSTKREKFATQINAEILRAVRGLAGKEGRQIQALVEEALTDLLEKARHERRDKPRARELLEIAQQAARLPVLDHRSPDEILGYDEHGLPT